MLEFVLVFFDSVRKTVAARWSRERKTPWAIFWLNAVFWLNKMNSYVMGRKRLCFGSFFFDSEDRRTSMVKCETNIQTDVC